MNSNYQYGLAHKKVVNTRYTNRNRIVFDGYEKAFMQISRYSSFNLLRLAIGLRITVFDLGAHVYPYLDFVIFKQWMVKSRLLIDFYAIYNVIIFTLQKSRESKWFRCLIMNNNCSIYIYIYFVCLCTYLFRKDEYILQYLYLYRIF